MKSAHNGGIPEKIEYPEWYKNTYGKESESGKDNEVFKVDTYLKIYKQRRVDKIKLPYQCIIVTNNVDTGLTHQKLTIM